MQILPDRFVDVGHPSMSEKLVGCLTQMGLVMPFSAASILNILVKVVEASGEHRQVRQNTIFARCTTLEPKDRDLLCNELAAALPTFLPTAMQADAGNRQPWAEEAFCGLPIFLSEAGLQLSQEPLQLERKGKARQLLHPRRLEGRPILRRSAISWWWKGGLWNCRLRKDRWTSCLASSSQSRRTCQML